MQLNPIISVIIPAWNAGPFLSRCLNSLQKQTFSNFEVIIVDVESTDETAQIAQSYVLEDSRFNYYKYNFSPCGIGRNFGMDHSTAPYISFVDSDDELEKDMLEKLLQAAIESNADITVCDFDMVYPDRVISSFSSLEDLTIKLSESNLAEYYFRYSAAPKPNNYAWSRLYRRSFIEMTGVRYENILTSEDHLFNLMLYCSFPRIVHIGQSLYKYIQRDDSSVRITAKQRNQGEVYYTVFNTAQSWLEKLEKPFSEQILAIYAFTRVKSIVFYSELASLTEAQLQIALNAFLNGDKVKYYLDLCKKDGHLKYYCKIHNIKTEQVDKWDELLDSCLDKEKISFNGGWFA